MTETVDDFLAHYGIKGMRWGVRKSEVSGILDANGNPKNTLIDPKLLAVREAKAQKIEKQAAEYQKRSGELRQKALTSRRRSTKRDLNKFADEHQKMAETRLQDAQKVREGKLTSQQKKAIAGAAITVGLLAAYGAYSMKQSGEFNRLSAKGRSFMNGEGGKINFKRKESLASKDLDADDIMNQIVKDINPDYGQWGTNMNCRRCTFAYELRRRGYDVSATKTSNASGQTAIGVRNALRPGEKFKKTGTLSTINQFMSPDKDLKEFTDNMNFPAGAKNKIKSKADISAKDIFDRLNKEESGSRGEFAVTWKSAMPGIPGGGHSMAYEIIKGKAHIFDGQTGERYDSTHEIFKQIQDAGFTRLDNVDLNLDYLARWVKER